ncbi:hypothetical protein DERF_014953 [Dermatophagoides farinae]|uniref:Uncharacterized protein n=1 Tax=Dermatophagoides farinae TaxID=6954 RepID=A0A922HQ98_DERFA|nr:hypothetical protein DERF_014953 [Dermatophagoides farinae]
MASLISRILADRLKWIEAFCFNFNFNGCLAATVIIFLCLCHNKCGLWTKLSTDCAVSYFYMHYIYSFVLPDD